MARPARIDIDLSALRHNYQLAKTLAKDRVLAVVKGNAYGHGAVRIAQALADIADGFAVACIEEALALREAGIEQSIVLLEGFFETSELALIDRYRLDCVLHDKSQVAALLQARFKQPIRCWLKLDSGMNRIGFDSVEYVQHWQALAQCAHVASVVHMTHFSCADDRHAAITGQQIGMFETLVEGMSGARSLQNSPGLLAWPQANSDWARAGLMLYGISPFAEHQAHAAALQPVMQASSRIIATKYLQAGDTIGYGQTFTATESMRIGIVAFGYADGYPIRAPSGTLVRVNGQPARLVGRVSMDMLAIDVTQVEPAQVGSEVILWGRDVPLETLARESGDIPYTVLCNAKRAMFYYHT